MKTIDWNYPPPRTGWSGLMDRFIGPGATQAEVILQTVLPLLAALVALFLAGTRGVEWTPLQTVTAFVLALDLVGGVFTNATSSAKRWYHRTEQKPIHHLRFVAIHLIHLSIVSWVFLGWQWSWVAVAGTYLFGSVTLIVTVPLYLQRPISLTLFAGSLILTEHGLMSPIGLEWFLPLFYLKLLVSHIVREEPYRPING